MRFAARALSLAHWAERTGPTGKRLPRAVATRRTAAINAMWLHGSPGLLIVYLPLLLLVLAKLLAELALIGLVVAIAAIIESLLFTFIAARAFKRNERRFWTRAVTLGAAAPVVLSLLAWLNFVSCGCRSSATSRLALSSGSAQACSAPRCF